MVILSSPPEWHYQNTPMYKYIERLLLEDATSDLKRQTWAKNKYENFKQNINHLLSLKALPIFNFKTDIADKRFSGLSYQCADISYVFLKKDIINNASFFINIDDTENVIYVACLEDPESITKEDLIKLLNPQLEASFIHEIIHLLDNARYKGNKANINVPTGNSEEEIQGHYNHPLEFTAHLEEITNAIYNYFKEDINNLGNEFSIKDFKEEMINELKNARLNKESIFNANFIKTLWQGRYGRLLSRISEFIDLLYSEWIKENG